MSTQTRLNLDITRLQLKEMKVRRHRRNVGFQWCYFSFVALLSLAGFQSACRQRRRPLYAVIPKAQAHIYWQAIHAGALKAALEANVDIIWNGPATESDYAGQIAITEDFISRHVDGIEIAPTDRDALVNAIRRARDAQIPLTVIDSGANTEDYVSFVATDNYGGGVIAARRLAEILKGHGNVAVIALLPGSGSTTAREEGFKNTIAKEFPKVKIVAFQYGMSDRSRSLAITEDILTAYPTLDGIFASAEPGSIGAAQALKERGLVGKVKLVGFDTSASLVEDLRGGVIDSLVVQDPFRIGYLGLKTLIDARAGHTPPKHIDLPPTLVTLENLSQPSIRVLVSPDVEGYLH